MCQEVSYSSIKNEKNPREYFFLNEILYDMNTDIVGLHAG